MSDAPRVLVSYTLPCSIGLDDEADAILRRFADDAGLSLDEAFAAIVQSDPEFQNRMSGIFRPAFWRMKDIQRQTDKVTRGAAA
jgi:hypothetical protein